MRGRSACRFENRLTEDALVDFVGCPSRRHERDKQITKADEEQTDTVRGVEIEPCELEDPAQGQRGGGTGHDISGHTDAKHARPPWRERYDRRQDGRTIGEHRIERAPYSATHGYDPK